MLGLDIESIRMILRTANDTKLSLFAGKEKAFMDATYYDVDFVIDDVRFWNFQF